MIKASFAVLISDRKTRGMWQVNGVVQTRAQLSWHWSSLHSVQNSIKLYCFLLKKIWLKYQNQNNIKYNQKHNNLVALAFYIKSVSPTCYVPRLEIPEMSRSTHISKRLLFLEWNNKIHSCSMRERKKKAWTHICGDFWF